MIKTPENVLLKKIGAEILRIRFPVSSDL